MTSRQQTLDSRTIRVAPDPTCGLPLAALFCAVLAVAPVQACDDLAGAGFARVASVDARGEIRLTDGRVLRLAGIIWPSANRPETRAKLARIVAEMTQVGEVRTRVAAPIDRWGRHAAELIAGKEWVQGRLVEDGHALAWPEAAVRTCWPKLLERDMLARDGKLGVWSALGRRPSHTVGWRREDGFPRRVVFEGVVRAVRSGRSVIFVNFVGPRASTPSWFVSKRLSADFSRSGRDVATFQGKRLRLRAEFSATPTPRLSVATPEGVELLD